MTSLSAGWRLLAASSLPAAIATALRGRWTPTLRLRGLTRRGRFTSLEAGLVVTLATDSTLRLHRPADRLVAALRVKNALRQSAEASWCSRCLQPASTNRRSGASTPPHTCH